MQQCKTNGTEFLNAYEYHAPQMLKTRGRHPNRRKHTFLEPRHPPGYFLVVCGFLVFDVWFPSGHFHEQRQHSGQRSHQQSDLHRNGVYGILLVQDFPAKFTHPVGQHGHPHGSNGRE